MMSGTSRSAYVKENRAAGIINANSGVKIRDSMMLEIVKATTPNTGTTHNARRMKSGGRRFRRTASAM